MGICLGASMNRYTPTCVGKTIQAYATSKGLEVHPHVCGENEYIKNGHVIGAGTPPRVWGKLVAQLVPLSKL